MNINLINLCAFGNSDLSRPSVFDDTIESIAFLLELAGFKTIFSRNTFATDALNILWGVGSHNCPSYQALNEYCNYDNTIVFNMEQIDSGTPLVNTEYIDFISRFRIFDYSIHNILAMRKVYPFIQAEEFPLLPSLHFSHDYVFSNSIKKFHFAFYGALNSRRLPLLNKLIDSGISIKIINSSYGKNLATELSDCHAVLNIHHYDTGIFEIARILRPFTMGLPIVSEVSKMPQLINWELTNIHFIEFDYLYEYCMKSNINNLNEVVLPKKSSNHFLSDYFSNQTLVASIKSLINP